MTIKYKGNVVTKDTALLGKRTLGELFHRDKPPLIKLDPGEYSQLDSVKIYLDWTNWYGWYEEKVQSKGEGTILIGEQIKGDPICRKNGIEWSSSDLSSQSRRRR